MQIYPKFYMTNGFKTRDQKLKLLNFASPTNQSLGLVKEDRVNFEDLFRTLEDTQPDIFQPQDTEYQLIPLPSPTRSPTFENIYSIPTQPGTLDRIRSSLSQNTLNTLSSFNISKSPRPKTVLYSHDTNPLSIKKFPRDNLDQRSLEDTPRNPYELKVPHLLSMKSEGLISNVSSPRQTQGFFYQPVNIKPSKPSKPINMFQRIQQPSYLTKNQKKVVKNEGRQPQRLQTYSMDPQTKGIHRKSPIEEEKNGFYTKLDTIWKGTKLVPVHLLENSLQHKVKKRPVFKSDYFKATQEMYNSQQLPELLDLKFYSKQKIEIKNRK